MGTRYSARFHAPAGANLRLIVAELASGVTAVDNQMSNWKADSDLSRLNRTAPDNWVSISANLAALLVRAIEIGRETGNAFNIGVGDLVDAWGFGPSGSQRPPDVPAGPRPCPPVDELLEIDVVGSRARKHGPVALDLCGIAKGFGVDELARVLDRHGIDSWLVGIDGEVRSRGGKPDGSAWAIALEAPEDERRAAMGVVELRDAAIATSGDYRHWIKVDGKRVSHTMDPRTSHPLQGTLASVTVISPVCADADAYATALMVLGEEAGHEHARRLGLDAFFVARAGDGLRATGTGFFGGA
ncbi:thiamine biosynthesis lipoprotein [Variovorax soli]|uniref:FAD:protein FMN transferase n=2 Tax=Variovorax soli TaxID=376815 RepID=A0ABU1NKZ9_9BURK|nr:thiamine biosynthesis lipoprotein [Variovorax soli]